MTTPPANATPDMDATADSLTAESTRSGLTAEQYKRKMERRKEVQQQRLAARTVEKRVDHRPHGERQGEDDGGTGHGAAIAGPWLPGRDHSVHQGRVGTSGKGRI